MEFIKYIILGIIQGLTEFLPISSSGHLELAKTLMGDDFFGQESLFVTVVLHFATACSTIIVFWKDISLLIAGVVKKQSLDSFIFLVKIIISMLPAVFVGIVWEEYIDSLFGGSILLVGIALIVTGGVLFFADKAKTTPKGVSYSNAFIIGLAQAIAILPGISRSGSTIATSVLLGIDRTKAARFSFLMVVPLIFGKMSKDLLTNEIHIQSSEILPLIIGFFVAFIVGFFACKWMVLLVRKARLLPFSVYCFLIGIISIIFSLYGF